jgi:hypothetical protein
MEVTLFELEARTPLLWEERNLSWKFGTTDPAYLASLAKGPDTGRRSSRHG